MLLISLDEAGEILASEITPFLFLMHSILIHFFFLKDHMLMVFNEKHTYEWEFLNVLDTSSSANKTLTCKRKSEMQF